MIRTTYLVLLSATTLTVLARIVLYHDISPAAQTRLMGQRPSATDTVTSRALQSETRDSRSQVARDPYSVAPLVGHIATLDASDALDIGEPQSVDETAWWSASTEVIEFGKPLNADNPTAWWNVTSEVMELGEMLDATDPTAWAGQESPPMPREIGTQIDAYFP
jgi:hypothetical protein